MPEKKYYWIKLKPTFFTSKEIKKLRRIAGGDTYVVIYLKMQLLSLETGGKLYYDGVEDDFAEELALTLDEDTDNVKMTLAFLTKYGLLEQVKEDEFFMPEVSINTGKEGASAQRVRKHRELQSNEKALQCNIDVTKRNTEIEKDIDIEIEKERDNSADKPRTRARFTAPTLEEVKAYCDERKNGVDPQRFIDYYSSNGWKVGRNPMKDWKAAVRTWEKNGYDRRNVNAGTYTDTTPVRYDDRGGYYDAEGNHYI